MVLLKHLDIISLLSSYGTYHNNKMNVFIHLIWVPLLDFTLIALLNHLQFSFLRDSFPFKNEENFLGFIVVSIFHMIYIFIDLPSGVIYFYFLYINI